MDHVTMQKQTEPEPIDSRPKMGRPRGDSTQINVAFGASLLEDIDAWARTQEREIGRTEAIRRLVALGCSGAAQREYDQRKRAQRIEERARKRRRG